VSAFKEIFAQDAAIDSLRAAVLADRLPHGLIFAGPVGVGKATTARALARLFLCEKPKGDQPCGTCEGCRGMAADVHPDFHLIYRQLARVEKKEAAARDLSVKVVREYLIAPANHKSVMNRGKVFLIKEAETMSTEAQNALLKTLEEPPGRSLLILLTSMPNVLLPTIRSRCQLLKFAALPQQVVTEQLQKRGINAVDAADAALITEGSLGLSINWLNDGIIEAARDFAGRLDHFSPAAAAELPDWLKKFAESYVARQQGRDENISKDVASREGLTIILTAAANHLRRSLASASGDRSRLESLCESIEAAVATERYLDANVSVALALEQFSSTLSATLVA